MGTTKKKEFNENFFNKLFKKHPHPRHFALHYNSFSWFKIQFLTVSPHPTPQLNASLKEVSLRWEFYFNKQKKFLNQQNIFFPRRALWRLTFARCILTIPAGKFHIHDGKISVLLKCVKYQVDDSVFCVPLRIVLWTLISSIPFIDGEHAIRQQCSIFFNLNLCTMKYILQRPAAHFWSGLSAEMSG